MAFSSKAGESLPRTGCFGAQGIDILNGGTKVETRTNAFAESASMAANRELKSSIIRAWSQWGEKSPPEKYSKSTVTTTMEGGDWEDARGATSAPRLS